MEKVSEMIQNCHNGILTFTSNPHTVAFKDLFVVKVGCVAKKKNLAFDPSGVFFASSKSHECKHAMYSPNSDKPDEWIRKPTGEVTDIFCHCKTRSEKPFFTTPTKMQWDGAVLGLFPTDLCKQLFESKAAVVEYMNSQPWDEIGFKAPDGRFQVGQRALSECYLLEIANDNTD